MIKVKNKKSSQKRQEKVSIKKVKENVRPFLDNEHLENELMIPFRKPGLLKNH